jgi:hypothetical protein
MEKVGSRQRTNRATGPHPVLVSPTRGIQSQRTKTHTWGDRTPRSKIRRGTTTTLTQADEEEKRKEIKQRSPTGARSATDKFR